MCLYVEYEGELFSEGERKARKTHTCKECEREIEPGERYRFWVVKDEDDRSPHTDKMCGHCWGTIELGAAITGCPKSWFWGEVHSLDEEMGFVGNIIHDEGHSLTPKQKQAMLDTVEGRGVGWRVAGVLMPVPDKFEVVT